MFPPNRDSQGGSAWWLDVDPELVLVDCPPLTEASLTALLQLAGMRSPRILLTSREGHGRLRRLQERLGWPVLVQEQEAYLLPNVEPLETFADEHTTASVCGCCGRRGRRREAVWCTPRHQTSCCSAGVC